MSLLKFLSKERVPFQVPRRWRSGWTEPPQDVLRWLRFVPIVGTQALTDARERMRQATHHMDASPCAWPIGCPTHILCRIERGGTELAVGLICAHCGLLDREYAPPPAFESWEPFKILDEHSTVNLRRLIERHPANFRAWSTYVPQQPASAAPYR